MFYEVSVEWINCTNDSKGNVVEKKVYEKYLVRAANIPTTYKKMKKLQENMSLLRFKIVSIKETNFIAVIDKIEGVQDEPESQNVE